ncbi:ABC transporter substrate-binding protein [Facklamia hominis]|uniref:ABC transporter substrate-binding protein n=1 Tax=Facklamia hominis TaxID=178214 RepID=UPI00101B7BF8|nr:ABC transporter substrate-binding protein [Facklamia hominis]RYC97636.1 ABC transporter substrate-binding protein [Facklamia hominis]
MKLKKISLISVLVFLVSIILPSSPIFAEEHPMGGTMTYAVTTDLKALNRHLEGYKDGHIILQPLFDRLYYVDTDETRYYLAESYDISEDGLEITVKLRDNMKWHDGEPINADDLIYTLKVVQDPKSGTTTEYLGLGEVNGKPVSVEKIDDLTVKVTLPEYNSAYANQLGFLTLLPEHIYGPETNIKDNVEANNSGIGSGEYKLKEWKKGESVVYERNEDYYLGKAPLDTLVFKIMPEKNTQEVALANGDLSVVEITTDQQIDKYAADDSKTIYSFPEGRVNYLGISKYSTKFADNDDARKAIVYALNKEEIVRGAYGSEQVAQVGDSTFGPKTMYRNEEFEDYPFDLEKAKELAEKSGLAGQKISLIYNNDRANQKESAVIIQQQLAQIGITCDVQGIDASGFFEKAFSDSPDVDLYLNGYPAAGDPGMLGFMFNIKNINKSEKQEELWKQALDEKDESKRKEIYKELQDVIKEDTTMIPIAYPNYVMVADKGFKGLDVSKTIPVFEDYMQLYYEK